MSTFNVSVLYIRGKTHQLTLKRDEYTVNFEAELLRVDSSHDYRYVFKIKRMTEKNYQEFIKLLYDRVPHLPDRILDSSIINDIKLNIFERQKTSKEFLRKRPRVALSKTFVTKTGEKVQAINFNYQYFLFDLDEELPKVEIPLFTHPQITLKCEVIQTITREDGTYYLYEIKNAKDIP